MLSQARADGSQHRKDCRKEDGAAAADQIIDRVRDPRGEESNGNVRARVDETDNPAILPAQGRVRSALVAERRRTIRDPELLCEGQIGAIRTRLVPALDGGSNGVEDNCDVQDLRQLPAVRHFFAENDTVILIELLDLVDESGRLRSESAFDENRGDFLELVLTCEAFYIRDQLRFGKTDKRVADPVVVSKFPAKVLGAGSKLEHCWLL